MYDFNAAVKPLSLRDMQAQNLEYQARQQELANARQQNQEGNIRLSQLGQQQKDQQALRDAYAKASQAGTSTQVQQPGLTFGDQTAPGSTQTVKGPGIDRNIMLSELGKTAPHLVPQVQETFAAQDQAQAKASLEQQSAKLAVAGQQIQRTAAVLAQAKDQPSYDAARQQLIAEGIPGANQMPPQFDAGWVGQHVQGAVPILDQIKAHQEDTKNQIAAAAQKSTAQHNANEEALTKRGQDVTAATAKRGQDMQYGSFNSPIQPGVTGQAALAQMPPSEAAAVQAIGDGKIDFATMTSRMPPAVKSNLAAKVLAYNPNYDQRNFGAGAAAMNTVAKSEVPTSIGNQKVAFNTAIAHAELLDKAAAALQNGDQQTLNGLKNAFANEFGASGPITAQTIANAYTGETTKMLDGGHITDSELGKIGKTIDPSRQNLATVRSVTAAYKALAQSKMDQLTKQEQSALKNPAANGGAADHHIIQVGAKLYQYNGSGDTADLKNYTEVAK